MFYISNFNSKSVAYYNSFYFYDLFDIQWFSYIIIHSSFKTLLLYLFILISAATNYKRRNNITDLN